MRNVILLMHVSLDGFVAGPNGEMDWIRMDDAFLFVKYIIGSPYIDGCWHFGDPHCTRIGHYDGFRCYGKV